MCKKLWIYILCLNYGMHPVVSRTFPHIFAIYLTFPQHKLYASFVSAVITIREYACHARTISLTATKYLLQCVTASFSLCLRSLLVGM